MQLTDKEIDDLLYTVPSTVDYTTFPEDLDPCDIKEDRVFKLEYIVNNKNHSEDIIFRAGILLCSWGNKVGLEYISNLVINNDWGYIDNRKYGYDETGEHILNALVSYWAYRVDLDREQGIIARKDIFEIICKIIYQAGLGYFSINPVFRLIKLSGFDEYILPIKEYLEVIMKSPDGNYWNIHDTINLLIKIDKEFVDKTLLSNNKSLADFRL